METKNLFLSKDLREHKDFICPQFLEPSLEGIILCTYLSLEGRLSLLLQKDIFPWLLFSSFCSKVFCRHGIKTLQKIIKLLAIYFRGLGRWLEACTDKEGLGVQQFSWSCSVATGPSVVDERQHSHVTNPRNQAPETSIRVQIWVYCTAPKLI